MNPNQQANQQSNRLHLNFNFQNQHNFAAEQGRAFPTTPSTFPQPYPNAAGQQEVWGTNSNPNSGFTQSGYFMNNPYTSSMQQTQNNLQNNLQSPANLQSPSAQYARSPLSPGGYQDATNGLAAQLAHQNLGRAPSPYGRQPSPAQRPKTNNTQQQPQYGQFLGQAPAAREQPSVFDDEPPMKNPQRFSSSISNRAKVQTELVGTFFKDSVERARERNGRSVQSNMPIESGIDNEY